MSIRFEELPGWQFRVDEVSAGVFRVVGSDAMGHRTVAEGLDPDALLYDCRLAAAEIAEAAARSGK